MDRTAGRNVTEGSIWKQLILFTLPILLGSLFQQLYNTADAIIVGQFAGKEALAAIDATGSLVRLFTNLFIGISTGATILIAQQHGAKEHESISETLHVALTFALLAGLALAVLGNLLANVSLSAMGVPQEIRPEAGVYLRIYFLGMIPAMVYNMAAGIYRAVGDTKRPLYFLIVSSIVNIGLDLWFVRSLGWGVAGAGWATLISQVVSVVLILLSLSREKGALRLEFRKLRLRKAPFLSIMRVGLPIGIQSTMYPLSNSVVQASINRLGTDTIAAWAVCGKIDFPIWLVMDALGIAISTFAAQNYGAKQYDRVRKSVRACFLLALAVVVPLSAALYLFGGQLSYLFVQDAAVNELSTMLIRFYSPFFFTFIAGEVLSGAIRGTGETFRPMLLTMTCTCLFRIVWVLFIVPLNPTVLMTIATYPITWCLTSTAFILYYRRHAKIALRPRTAMQL